MRNPISKLKSTKDKNRQVFNSFLASIITGLLMSWMIVSLNSWKYMIIISIILIGICLKWFYKIKKDMGIDHAFSFYINYVTGIFSSLIVGFFFYPTTVTFLTKMTILIIFTIPLIGISLIIVSYTQKYHTTPKE